MIVVRLLAALVLFIAAPVVYAQSSAPIHACVTAKNGKVRIVPSATSCTDKESALSWNVDGAPQLIGLTTETFTGDEGLLGFTAACQAQYPGTRLCTSQEVIRTTTIPAGLSGSAWVLFTPTGGPGNGTIVDASGVTNSPHLLTCDGWIVAAGNTTGLAVEFSAQNGSFAAQLCSEPRKVSCCGWPSR
jgi:hypothetical protein